MMVKVLSAWLTRLLDALVVQLKRVRRRKSKKRVVVVGASFGGLTVLQELYVEGWGCSCDCH